MAAARWDGWVEEAVSKLEALKLLRSLRPINHCNVASKSDALQVFDGLRQWDKESVQVQISEPTFQKWLNDTPSCGESAVDISEKAIGPDCSQPHRKLLLFSGNDYLGLSSHPTIRKAASKAALDYGMGPRGSALICGYTDYHWWLEAHLAALKKKEDCLICPTGFSANMAVMVAIGSVASLLASKSRPSRAEKVAVFSDALNHASIIDGLRLAERQSNVEVFVYRHCDMQHLNTLLTECTMTKKVVVTDSLFSMDGDFAPMDELVRLRKKHGFLLVIDDAHGTFVCGENGGGVAEEFNCEKDVDICVGTLSKAAGCHGGFIACSKKWKQLIQSRGRSFIFSTSIPVPVIAAAHGGVVESWHIQMSLVSISRAGGFVNHNLLVSRDRGMVCCHPTLLRPCYERGILTAVVVAVKESWRRRAIRERVQDFCDLTGFPVTSHIISLVIGSEEKALLASRHLLQSGFHVTAIRPPTVPPNSCRLRVALSAAHTRDDIKKLAVALSRCINSGDTSNTYSSELHAKL